MRAALAIALAALLAPALARAEAVVRVPAEAIVDQSSIRLGDISLVDGLGPELEDAVSALELGRAAAPAETRALSGRAIAQRVLAVDPSLEVDVPETVHVRTASRDVGPDEVRARLEAAIRQRMPWPAGAVRFVRFNLPETFAVPLHAERLLVHFAPGEDFRGRVTAQLEYVDADDTDAEPVRRSASAELEVRQPVAVAALDLRRGHPLDAQAVALEDRDLRRLPDDAVTDPEQVAGLPLARNLRAGTPLRLAYFDTPALVSRGELIAVQAGAGNLDLRLQAKALADGRLGQVIEVENPATRRRFSVEVSGDGTARLARGAP